MSPFSKMHPVDTIFIGGCPRSGTTLLGGLLGSASTTITTPESQFKTELARSIECGELQDEFAAITRVLRGNRRFRFWELPDDVPLVAPERVYRADSSTKSPLQSVSRRRRDSPPLEQAITAAVDAYASLHGKTGWTTWIDHTPDNIRNVGRLMRLFPNARFIHLVRDCRGVLASVKGLDWGPSGVIHGAEWWAARLAVGLAAEQRWPDRVLRVHFEELLQDPESELQRICSFTGLEFEPSMVAGTGYQVPRYTTQQHALVGKPPDASVGKRWRRTLAAREIEMIESEVGPVLEYLGYDLEYGARTHAPSAGERLREVLRRIPVRMMKNLKKTRRESRYD